MQLPYGGTQWILHVFYAIWDFTDDRLFKKTNDSDCTQYELMYPKTKAHHWAIGWIFFEIIIFVVFIIVGLIVFKRTPDEMASEAGEPLSLPSSQD
ncbi:hypothetical protein FRB99_007098 [Tulasnella sp. 403]|nr:hypothetical protein FRB99_007098 [Tulasnella sp. 403]